MVGRTAIDKSSECLNRIPGSNDPGQVKSIAVERRGRRKGRILRQFSLIDGKFMVEVADGLVSHNSYRAPGS